MGLINPKNMVAPLTNKVHLTTILLGALLFVVLRFSHGTLTAGRAPDPDVIRREPARVEPKSKAAVQPVQRVPERKVEPLRKPAERKLPHKLAAGPEEIDSLLDMPVAPWNEPSKPLPGEVKKRPVQPQGGLDDIERELGLR